jgi:hypothetical protein
MTCDHILQSFYWHTNYYHLLVHHNRKIIKLWMWETGNINKCLTLFQERLYHWREKWFFVWRFIEDTEFCKQKEEKQKCVKVLSIITTYRAIHFIWVFHVRDFSKYFIILRFVPYFLFLFSFFDDVERDWCYSIAMLFLELCIRRMPGTAFYSYIHKIDWNPFHQILIRILSIEF